MALLFRRKSAETRPEESQPEVVEESAQARKGYTPKKGEATPKRVADGRRPGAPPADRKEALARQRTRQRELRAESRAGMMAGDERYLLPKDKGPVRRLARDLVDSRYNVATLFFYTLFVVLLLSMTAFPPAMRLAANGLFLFMFLATLVDVALLVRRIKRLGAERFPKVTDGYRGLMFYVLMRAVSMRRLRIPKPQVKVGDKI